MIDKKVLDEIKKSIQQLEQKSNKTEKENLNLRNLQRIVDSEEKQSVYCPAINAYTQKLMMCMFCPYGHMTECHYPHTCDEREYCNHYKEEEEDLDEAY